MVELKVNLDVIDKFKKFLDENRKKSLIVLFGGAGSGKSVFAAQTLVIKLITEKDIRILVIRKTLPSLKITAFKLIIDMLRAVKLPFSLNKTEMLITYGTNEMLFKSLDDPEKIKSYEANYIWIEEATDVTIDDFNQLKLRMRRKNTNGKNQMFLTFNPIDAFHWLIVHVVDATKQGIRKDAAIMHSTYKDNPYLTQDYCDHLESLAAQDENFYRIYTLGEPGVLTNLIFNNWHVVDKFPNITRPDGYGLDFGYNAPMALTRCWWYDREFWFYNILYATKMTNADLIKWMDSHGIEKDVPIYADSAEPKSIEDLRRAGYCVIEADKDVKKGIDKMKSHRMNIHPNSVDAIRELRNYKYREQKFTHQVLDDPVKQFDHFCDSARYFAMSVVTDGESIPIDFISCGGSDMPFMSFASSLFHNVRGRIPRL